MALTTDYKLAAIPPETDGKPFKLWLKLQLDQQFSDNYKNKQHLDPADAPINRQRVWNKRDSYGL